MSDETKPILMNKEVIDIDQNPAAKPVQSLSVNVQMETLTRTLADGSLIVGIFNRRGTAMPTALRWSSLPAGYSGKKLAVRDLWKHESVAVSGEQYNESVPAHGVLFSGSMRPTKANRGDPDEAPRKSLTSSKQMSESLRRPGRRANFGRILLFRVEPPAMSGLRQVRD